VAASDEEEQELRAAALQNAQAILAARQKAEQELVRANEALHQRTQEVDRLLAMLRATLESSTDAILVTDGPRRVVDYNEKFVAMWNPPRDVLESRRHAALAAFLGGQFRAPASFLARVEEIEATAPADSYDLLELADGRKIERFSSRQLIAGHDVGRVWSFRDVTDRRNAEEALYKQSEALRVTLASIGDAVITTDADGRVTSLNAVAEALTGWTNDAAQGRALFDVFRIVNERTRQPVENPAIRALRERRVVGLANHTTLIARDGTQRAIDDSAAPIRSRNGDVLGVVLIFRDITEQRRSEQALRESESQLRMVMDHAPVIISRCDRERRFRFVNRAYAERFGRQPAEIVGKTIAEVLGAAADRLLDPYIEQVLAGKSLEYDLAIPYDALGLRYMRCAYEPEWDADGEVQGWVAVLNDITDRQQAEKNKALLGAIVASSNDAIVSKTLDGTITSWNAAAEQLFGYTASEAIGQSVMMLIPEDRHHEEAVIISRLSRGERIEHYETQRATKSGRRVDVSLSISPLFDERGVVIGASKIARDISGLRHAERTARFLAEASGALAQISDLESTLQRIAGLAVPFFADWCAVDMLDADGSVRRLAVTHVDPSKTEAVLELSHKYPPHVSDTRGVHKVLRSGQSTWAPVITEQMLVESARDGEHLRALKQLGLHSYLCVPLKSRGTVLGALTFATAQSARTYQTEDLAAAEDLAHRAVIAIENANLLAALKDSDKRKDEFLAMLAHELRNPLAPIRNSVQVLHAMSPPDEQLRWAREVIDRQIGQMSHLIDDLLDISRISRGKIELRKERVALAAVVADAVESSQPLIDAAGHKLTVALAAEPIYLEADLTRLSQALLNLLNNAAKYTDPGGQIMLVAETEEEQVVVRIKDNGIGIPPAMLSSVFEMFTQVDNSLERAKGGLGIGLTLVRRLVELHGGTVAAHSKGHGQGSEFVVRLPRAAAPESTAEPPATSVAPGDRPRRRILVVDDNHDSAKSLAMLLRLQGNDVRTAHDGLEAVEVAAELQPAVIVMDIGLPKLNGYEAARRIRDMTQREDLVLIALTGWGQEEDRRRSREAGFNHHLTKPVDFAKLQALLAESHGNL
jgi:PAS domain S-box-containing protein